MHDRTFVLLVWCVSRALIVVGMLAIAPALPAPHGGSVPAVNWSVFDHWDGGWFRLIATSGYEYAPDGKEHAVAFFPLYPLASAALMRLGLPFAAAGTLASNLAFAGLLVVVFDWVRERYGRSAARWTVATLCFCPLSLFTAIAYSESLFMLLCALALRDFERGRELRAGGWAALASATRIAGIGLAPAFAVAAFAGKRGPKAYAAAVGALVGPACFALYCAARFGDALAPFHAQAAWRHDLGFVAQPWIHVLALGTVVEHHWVYQLGIVALAAVAWKQRRRLAPWRAYCAWLALVWAELALWSNDRMKFFVVGLGTAALLAFRRQLDVAPFAYGLTGVAIIVAAGAPISIERIAFGILPFDLALALLWVRVPLLGCAALSACAVELVRWSIAFAQWLWVA